jgi:16S rRNA (cytidine1402-2'-O)-methyltransferase
MRPERRAAGGGDGSGAGASVRRGALHVVATPIGNLEDMTLRAARVLGEVDIVLAEDTRRTRTLLAHLGRGGATLVSLHEHNERHRIGRVLDWLHAGKALALVSDGGTPGISDPGFPLVRAVVEAGFPVLPIPGPSAMVAAVSASGLPTDRILFLGFLPQRTGRRRRLLGEALGSAATVVVHVSPHKLKRDLEAVREVAGSRRPACLAREISKIHEEFDRGTMGELCERWVARKALGEFTLVVAGAAAEAEEDEGGSAQGGEADEAGRRDQ